MKKFLVIAVLFMLSVSASYSQVVVEDVNINELDIKYCELSRYNKGFFTNKIVITVSYGQKFKWWKYQRIVDSEGHAMVFGFYA